MRIALREEEEGDEKKREPIVGESWEGREMYGWFGQSCCWRCMRARPVSVFCLVPTKKMWEVRMPARTWKYFNTHLPFCLDSLSITLDCCSFSGVQGCNAFLPWLPQTYRFLHSVKKAGGSFQSACLSMERRHGLSPSRLPARFGPDRVDIYSMTIISNAQLVERKEECV